MSFSWTHFVSLLSEVGHHFTQRSQLAQPLLRAVRGMEWYAWYVVLRFDRVWKEKRDATGSDQLFIQAQAQKGNAVFLQMSLRVSRQIMLKLCTGPDLEFLVLGDDQNMYISKRKTLINPLSSADKQQRINYRYSEICDTHHRDDKQANGAGLFISRCMPGQTPFA